VHRIASLVLCYLPLTHVLGYIYAMLILPLRDVLPPCGQSQSTDPSVFHQHHMCVGPLHSLHHLLLSSLFPPLHSLFSALSLVSVAMLFFCAFLCKTFLKKHLFADFKKTLFQFFYKIFVLTFLKNFFVSFFLIIFLSNFLSKSLCLMFFKTFSVLGLLINFLFHFFTKSLCLIC
jgi:hypothetical protein